MCGCLSCILYWGSRSGTLGTPCPVACVAPSPSMGPELGAMRLDAPGDLPPTSFFSPPCHLPGVHSPSNPYLGFVCLCCEHVCAPASLWGCPEERALCGRGQLDPRGSHLQSTLHRRVKPCPGSHQGYTESPGWEQARLTCCIRQTWPQPSKPALGEIPFVGISGRTKVWQVDS